MTTIPDNDNPTSLDARARRLHADALATVSPSRVIAKAAHTAEMSWSKRLASL